jgi:type III secretory pathway component EscV
MDIENKILLSIYSAQQNPKIHLSEVYPTLEAELGLKCFELLKVIVKLEIKGMLTRLGKKGVFLFVLTQEGRIYVEQVNKDYSDKVREAAKIGWPCLSPILIEIFKNNISQ